MSITVNESGTLYTLEKVTANEDGVLYDLATVHSNEGGVLYEIYGALPKEITWHVRDERNQVIPVPPYSAEFHAYNHTYLLDGAYTDEFSIQTKTRMTVRCASDLETCAAKVQVCQGDVVVHKLEDFSERTVTLDPGVYSIRCDFVSVPHDLSLDISITTI